ncbi:MAG: hypothetical protein R2697_10565 [Ilumatobacteraceae bacterium]
MPSRSGPGRTVVDVAAVVDGRVVAVVPVVVVTGLADPVEARSVVVGTVVVTTTVASGVLVVVGDAEVEGVVTGPADGSSSANSWPTTTAPVARRPIATTTAVTTHPRCGPLATGITGPDSVTVNVADPVRSPPLRCSVQPRTTS